jgi:glyoxylase-like metal-dependent hydrolase (beta-lactamase superfamily II)
MFRGRDTVEHAEISKNIWMIDEQAGLIYLIKGRDKCAVIDTGFGHCDLPAMIRHIAGEMPVIVINTHAHLDHVNGNYMFGEAYIGYLDEPHAAAGYCDIDKNKMLSERPDFYKQIGVTAENWDPGCGKKFNLLYAGDIIDLGGIELEVFEFTGHTLGSIVLLERKSGILFTGDTVFTKEIWLHIKDAAKLSVYLRSLNKLRKDLNGAAKILAAGHVKEDYLLPPGLLDSLAEGISGILSGSITGSPTDTGWGSGLIVEFEGGGGVIYNPERL